MKRIVICLIVLLTIGIAAMPSAAQAVPRAPIFIDSSTNDDVGNAHAFSPSTEIFVSDVEDASIEASESEHTCALPAAGAGTESVWFQAELVPGTVTLDTAGSAYGTAGGPSSNTVISLYRLDNFVFNDFSDLDPVACNENGTGAGIINAFNITLSGRYYVQVSASPAITVTGASTVVMTGTANPTGPLANDEPSGARTVKFVGLPSVVGINKATRSLDEPTDPFLSDYITNTVWFKFTLTSPRSVGFSNFYTQAGDLWFSLFTFNGTSYVPANGIEEPVFDNSLQAQLAAGTYYLRVGIFGEPAGTSTFFITFSSVAYLLPHNYEFAVGTTEENPGAQPDLTGWTLKNGDAGPTGDGAFCDAVPDYKCYFQFASSGAGEKSILQAKINLNSVKLKRGDIIVMQAILLDMIGTPNFTATVTLKDAAGNKQNYTLTVNDASNLSPALVTQATASISPVKVIVKLKNKDVVPGNRVEIDWIIAAITRVGDAAPRGGTLRLLGGEISGLWATDGGSPKGVLPAPPAQ